MIGMVKKRPRQKDRERAKVRVGESASIGQGKKISG